MQELTQSFQPQLAGGSSVADLLWLIPAVPIAASGVIALLKQPRRKMAAGLAICSLAFSLLIVSCRVWPCRDGMGSRQRQFARRSTSVGFKLAQRMLNWAGCSIRSRR